MDARLKKAAEQSQNKLEKSIPSTLLHEIQDVAKNLSVPWIGLLLGALTPVQYALSFTNVELEGSDWSEPTIAWVIMHMPSGTRKSVIHKFVSDLMVGLEQEKNFKVNETTFEKLGLLMQDNGNKIIWFADEIRHFFAQLGMYQKGPSRDESVLLTLYDGGEWDHNTARGVQFSLPYTKLILGGLTQTAHILQLFNQKEQMESGLIPRFLTVLLSAVHTSVRSLEKGSDVFKNKLRGKIAEIKEFHSTKTRYILFRKTPAFELFAQYHDMITEWIKKHQYQMAYQNAITMVSKSVGHIFRISGILNALFLFWDYTEVAAYESGDDQADYKHYLNNKLQFIPISAMAMQASINLCTYALTQNLTIQGINFLQFDFEANIESMIHDFDYDSISINETDQNSVSVTDDKENDPSTCRSSQITDVGKVLITGGRILSAAKMNKNKKLGKKKTSKPALLNIFQTLESNGFGTRDTDSFTFSERIIDEVTSSNKMQEFLVTSGVTITMLKNALGKPNSIIAKKTTTSTIDSSISTNAIIPTTTTSRIPRNPFMGVQIIDLQTELIASSSDGEILSEHTSNL